MSFCHLNIQSEYSIQYSAIKLDELIKKAKEDGYLYLGLCDINSMHGAIKFYTKCQKANIIPIIGLTLKIPCELYSGTDSYLLIAKNYKGYLNLLKIASIVQIKKSVTIHDFINYFDDLAVVLASIENEFVRFVMNRKDVTDLIPFYNKIFNEWYVGLDFLSVEIEANFNYIYDFCKKHQIECMALDKALFLEKEDYDVYEIIRLVATNTKNYLLTERELNSYYKSKRNIVDMFRKYPRLIENNVNLVKRCLVQIPLDQIHMPVYKNDFDSKKYLFDLAIAGLKRRIEIDKIEVKYHKIYQERLLNELNVVSNMGFNDYFLIVYDFIKFAKKNNILVGPGRGSAPGALLSYCLGITEIDPLVNGLLFERFLNPMRISLPDIDTDFPDESRDIVIKYMIEKYGKERVAHITTFGTYGARMTIRDIIRVKEYDEVYLNEMLRYFDTSPIEESIERSVTLKQMIDENPIINSIIKTALKLENLPRNLSVHAAGIIMADTNLVEYTALSNSNNGLYQTQYEASDLENLGLVKIDFLGLKYLSIIDKIVNNIKRKNPTFDYFKIPLNDSKTFEMLRKQDTTGVFQLESEGMKKTLSALKVSKFNDIVDALALYRPGPMEMIPTFIKRKDGLENVDYIHEVLEDILKPTYGIIVYQEQIMQIASRFCNYSLGEADILRRAVSKKSKDLLEKEKAHFVKQAVKNHHQEKDALSIYELILKFANYGFNKSHSVAYALISYRMAYLKSNYPKEFMMVYLTYSDSSVKSLVMECNRANININPPSINISTNEFVISDGVVYFSLSKVIGVGEVIVNNIVNERKKNGLFTSYDDFIRRTKDFINRKIVEALIFSGAFDEFNIPRKQLIKEYDNAFSIAKLGQYFTGELAKREFKDEEYSFDEISNYERVALGFNLKYDIFKRYKNIKVDYKITSLCDVVPNKKYTLFFMIDKIKEITTKKQTKMAFIQIFDDTYNLDGVIFPDVYEQFKDRLYESKLYIALATIDKRDEKTQVIINKILYNN